MARATLDKSPYRSERRFTDFLRVTTSLPRHDITFMKRPDGRHMGEAGPPDLLPASSHW